VFDAVEGARLKVIAAQGHMDRLDQAVERFLEPGLDIATIKGQANSQRTQYIFRIEKVRRFPEKEWGIIVGDSVHCLRSALDQLAYGFAEKASEETSFPICLTEKEWVVYAPRSYWSVKPGFIRLIDKMQPYHRGDLEAAKAHPLAILGLLSNLDKHRSIPTVTLVADECECRVESYGGVKRWWAMHVYGGVAYEPGAKVARCRITPDDSDLEPEIEAYLTAALDVAFGEISDASSIRHRSVIEVMNEIGQYVSKPIAFLIDAWNDAVRNLDAVDYDAIDWKS
jgi:hypothetical protein